MIKGQTKSGFEYSVNEQVFASYDYAKLVKKMSDAKKLTDQEKIGVANAELTVAVTELILGSEQAERLEEHIREKSEDGLVSMQAMAEEVNEIQQQAGEIIGEKNSQSSSVTSKTTKKR